MSLLDEALDLDSTSADEPSFQDKSDQLFDASFGAGKFFPNAAGQRTFISQADLDQPSSQSTGQFQQSADEKFQRLSQLISDSESHAKPTGRNQIRNLAQLGAVAKALSGVPEELKQMILSHLLGLPYQGGKELALKNALRQLMIKRELESPDRELKQKAQQEGLDLRREGMDLRREGLESRQDQRQQSLQLQKAMMLMRREGRQSSEANRRSVLDLHKDMAKNTITNSIANLTRAMEATMDPKQKIELGKLLQQQHQLYQKFSGMDEHEDIGKEDKQSSGYGTAQ